MTFPPRKCLILPCLRHSCPLKDHRLAWLPKDILTLISSRLFLNEYQVLLENNLFFGYRDVLASRFLALAMGKCV